MGRLPVLSRRLRTAAAYVRDHSVAADVGCDHGKLSAFLLKSGRADYVYATDIKEQPLEKAAALLSSGEFEGRYECVLTDGLQGLPGERITDVIISGLGDDVIEHVIIEAPWLKNNDKQLILVPSSRHEKVRSFLRREGFQIKDETAVFEKKHCYTVINAVYSGVMGETDILERWLGLIDINTEDGQKYFNNIVKRLSAIVAAVEDIDNPSRREADEFLEAASGLLTGIE